MDNFLKESFFWVNKACLPSLKVKENFQSVNEEHCWNTKSKEFLPKTQKKLRKKNLLEWTPELHLFILFMSHRTRQNTFSSLAGQIPFKSIAEAKQLCFNPLILWSRFTKWLLFFNFHPVYNMVLWVDSVWDGKIWFPLLLVY